MSSNRTLDPHDEIDDIEHDASSTAVAEIPEAVLKMLKRPEVPRPQPKPVVAKRVEPPTPQAIAVPASEGEEDADESETLVASSARVPIRARRLSAEAIARSETPTAPPPPLNDATTTARRRIESIHDETTGSPDEDPSDTSLSTQIPQAIRPDMLDPKHAEALVLPRPPRNPGIEKTLPSAGNRRKSRLVQLALAAIVALAVAVLASWALIHGLR